MPRLNMEPTQKEVSEGERYLANNEYPGRVIIMGINSVGDAAIQAYAITGRSEGSRNRILVPVSADSNPEYTEGVRTVAPGMTPEEMAGVENSELIYYQAMDEVDGVHVVSNGAQTGPVLHRLTSAKFGAFDLEGAVRGAPVVGSVDLSKYEPDAPNFTPRITGAYNNMEHATPFGLSVVRKSRNSRARYSTYKGRDLKKLPQGTGYGVQTYEGNGTPLPSFDREPYAFPLGETAEETAHSIWEVLNKDNRVAVVVRTMGLKYEYIHYHVINARGPELHVDPY
jgi:IMP cyclohydrolase